MPPRVLRQRPVRLARGDRDQLRVRGDAPVLLLRPRLRPSGLLLREEPAPRPLAAATVAATASTSAASAPAATRRTAASASAAPASAAPASAAAVSTWASSRRSAPQVKEFDATTFSYRKKVANVKEANIADELLSEPLCGKQGLYGRPARPKRLIGRGWPTFGVA